MKAMVLRELDRPLVWEDVDQPTAAPDEVVIEVLACGADRTDLMVLDGFGYVPELPLIFGHETAGVVAELGADVTDFAVGDRVIAYNYFFCGLCKFCKVHRQQLCLNMDGLLGIIDRNGGYGEYAAVRARQLVRIPDNVVFSDAAVCCDAVITATHAVDRASVRLGETVLVIGVGGVGSAAVQLCKASGARVIAVDQTDAKTARALDLGADEALNSSNVNITEAVHGLTDGIGVDCVLDIVGRETTVTYGMDSLRRGGRLTLVGYTSERYPLKGEQLDQNELMIIGTRGGRKIDLEAAVGYVSDGTVQSIVTDVYPLEEANEALASLREGNVLGRTVLLTPRGSAGARQ